MHSHQLDAGWNHGYVQRLESVGNSLFHHFQSQHDLCLVRPWTSGSPSITNVGAGLVVLKDREIMKARTQTGIINNAPRNDSNKSKRRRRKSTLKPPSSPPRRRHGRRCARSPRANSFEMSDWVTRPPSRLHRSEGAPLPTRAPSRRLHEK